MSVCRRTILVVVLGAAVAACRSVPAAARGEPSFGRTASAPAVAGWDPVTRFLVDTAGSRMAALELQRLALAGAGAEATPQGESLARHLAALERQLAEVPQPQLAAYLATGAVLRALDAREAGLLVQRRQLLVGYTAESPLVRQVERETRALAQRRAELQARREHTEASR